MSNSICKGFTGDVNNEQEYLQFLHQEGFRLGVKVTSAPSDPLSHKDVKAITKAVNIEAEQLENAVEKEEFTNIAFREGAIPE
jgi:hypothetical protein